MHFKCMLCFTGSFFFFYFSMSSKCLSLSVWLSQRSMASVLDIYPAICLSLLWCPRAHRTNTWCQGPVGGSTEEKHKDQRKEATARHARLMSTLSISHKITYCRTGFSYSIMQKGKKCCVFSLHPNS